MSVITTLFGDANKRYLDSLRDEASLITELEPAISQLTDEQLKAKTVEFKQQLASGKTLDDIAYEAFAVVREAGKRTLNMRHFDVQLIGGLVLHRGQVAEMRTGEGKTLVSTLALYLNALEGKGVHLITVNDYLAKRDATWMGQIYDFLGLSVGVISHESAFIYDASHTTPADDKERDLGVKIEIEFLRPVTRPEAYLADITYGTNNEFGFDHLRDNLALNKNDQVQRRLNYAIVDEVDSILIDEARTPLIISAPDMESTDKYNQFAQLVTLLNEKEDYTLDEKMRAASLTDAGITKIEKSLGVANIYEASGIETVHHIEQALKAKTLFQKDKHYVVREGEILIVDEFTGRLMQGRRYSEGLHQAIEAKEGVAVQRENKTMATITIQNYFRMYKKLAGMTGTAATEAEELNKIYSLEVTSIPTNMPMIRLDQADRVYKNEPGKFKAVIAEIKERHEKGQPVLVGTISIEKNELLGELLNHEGIPFHLLNAKQHEKEAEVLAQAGSRGAVTVATNMAGRGVDIKLGGSPFDQAKHDEIVGLGGLHVLGTERHESRRIDNQLRGRSGRQGDPGSSQFYVSMDDELLRIFGSDRMKGVMNALGLPEDVPIENKMISKSIEGAQKKVEGHNFDIRKHLVEYDDVINKQREYIYRLRQQIIDQSATAKPGEPSPISAMMMDFLHEELESLVKFHATGAKTNWNLTEIFEAVNNLYSLSGEERTELEAAPSSEKLTDILFRLADAKYVRVNDYVQKHLGPTMTNRNALTEVEKSIILRTMDNFWVEHLDTIQLLRSGIGLQGYGQRDPLVEYKRESRRLFDNLLTAIRQQVVYSIFKISVAQQPSLDLSAPKLQLQEQKSDIKAFSGAEKDQKKSIVTPKPKDDEGHKIGRNDPCYCGSGKKYKKCHGQ
ncbi:MAG: preprotein translocase subunit SecA [Candidatus Komeilibacteria bacterium]